VDPDPRKTFHRQDFGPFPGDGPRVLLGLAELRAAAVLEDLRGVLPDGVLEKVYRRNAAGLLGSGEQSEVTQRLKKRE